MNTTANPFKPRNYSLQNQQEITTKSRIENNVKFIMDFQIIFNLEGNSH